MRNDNINANDFI